jgi:uncharacterized protein
MSTYIGMSRSTGRSVSGIDHIWQSCRDILTTRIGTRIARRSYGSLLPELIDQPGNSANMLRLRAATVMALSNWEPRIAINKVSISLSDEQGGFVIEMQATRTDGPQASSNVSLNIPIGGLR